MPSANPAQPSSPSYLRPRSKRASLPALRSTALTARRFRSGRLPPWWRTRVGFDHAALGARAFQQPRRRAPAAARWSGRHDRSGQPRRPGLDAGRAVAGARHRRSQPVEPDVGLHLVRQWRSVAAAGVRHAHRGCGWPRDLSRRFGRTPRAERIDGFPDGLDAQGRRQSRHRLLGSPERLRAYRPAARPAAPTIMPTPGSLALRRTSRPVCGLGSTSPSRSCGAASRVSSLSRRGQAS